MIIKKCTDISKDVLHQLSLKAYKDYIVDVSMDYDTFFKKFITNYKIDLNQSFVAIIDDQPVGFILGSINNYENIKTLRCAAFAVIKDFRNKNVGQQLFRRHLKAGIENNCERLFLEVIKENKAKSFYLREGYEIIDELFYYTLDLNALEIEQKITINFKPITNGEMNHYLIQNNVHINYQNHPIILKNSKENEYYQLIDQGKNIGAISFNPSGAISILHLKSDYETVEYLNSILYYLKSDNRFKDISISVTSEMNYISLFKATGFIKDAIEQFEMVKHL